jgi:hypothetical protein
MLRRPLTVTAGQSAILILLVPLVALVAGLSGPLPNEIVFGVVAPLLAVYPGLSAFIAKRSRAQTAVIGIAAAAPAFILAIRLLTEPVTEGRLYGREPDLWHIFAVRASLPALVLIATFGAIEVARAALRRPGRAWVIASFVLGAVAFGVGGLLAVVGWATLIDTR